MAEKYPLDKHRNKRLIKINIIIFQKNYQSVSAPGLFSLNSAAFINKLTK